jgi:hypothetical protein
MDEISIIDPKKASDIFCHNPRELSMTRNPSIPVYVANLQTALASSRYAGGASTNSA